MAGDEVVQFLSIGALTIFFGAFVLVVVVVFSKKRYALGGHEDKEIEDKVEHEKDLPVPDVQNKKENHQKSKGKPHKSKDPSFSHPQLLANLKGHTGAVFQLDFSMCGKYLASCSEDRTVRLWNTKDFLEKEHKYVRANVELDHATSVAFSPDTRAFLASLDVANTIRIFKVNKKKEGSGSVFVTSETEDFPKEHKADIIYVGIASTGKFIMSADKDTTLIIWSLKGERLATIDTLQVYNSFASIAPCGNLVASSGFTPDVKLWEIEFDKMGNFKQVSRALELKGHSAGVSSFSFSSDSKRMATVSKDGTWKIWDTDVDYRKGQEAYLLETGSFSQSFPNAESFEKAQIALSPDSYVAAVAVGKSIAIFNTQTKVQEEFLSDVHGDNINCLVWHPDSRQLASAGNSDRTIRIWHNPAGVRALILDLKEKLKKAKSDTIKERIEKQIVDANIFALKD